ncbi:lytic murein transglycosylase [Elstera litoralis]|nr:lytic murein transglycosylase [Elstera litoralis]
MRAMGIKISRGAALAAAMLLAQPAAAQDKPSFDAWLAGFRLDAAQKGISPRTLDAALTGIAPIPRVLELDQRQPEKTIRFETYRRGVVSDARVKAAKERAVQHRAALQAVSAESGVPAAFILALWAVESDFGRGQGGFAVIPSLATLAYDGRRQAFFAGELLAALTIIERGEATVGQLRGSWAGAMGQSQFMPSSYLKYAKDGDGDGKRDIWRNPRDVFASIANYLATVGWRQDLRWGREVRASQPVPSDQIGVKTRKSLSDWAALGVTRLDGAKLTGPAGLDASLIQPDGPEGPSYLVYDNFRTLMDWNRSTYFATAVGLLADRIGDG